MAPAAWRRISRAWRSRPQGDRIAEEAEYVAAYCRRRKIGKIADWPTYLAFSFFRLAAILQGVYKRFLDGNASNPQLAKAYGAAVPLLGQLAMEVIEKEN